jgi:hypothetical protein
MDGIHGTPYIAAPWILWDVDKNHVSKAARSIHSSHLAGTWNGPPMISPSGHLWIVDGIYMNL